MNDLTQKSKYLSLLLRHKPENANLTMDKNGWVSICEIVKNTTLTVEEIEEIVKTDNKQRYSINKQFVRANQGHSISWVEVDSIKKEIPPIVLFHGTKHESYLKIKKNGLSKMKRSHVHLSENFTTATDVGNRRKGITVILEIYSRKMWLDGYTFYKSENGVWLTDSVPPQYLKPIDLV